MRVKRAVIPRLWFDEGRMRLRLRRPAPRAVRAALFLTFTLAPPAVAQVVRGTVRDAGSNAPLSGIVVSIHRATATTFDDRTREAATLSDAQGRFGLSPADTGHFVVVARRIGVRPFRSAPFALGHGQTHRVDIRLEGVRFDLPVVTVSGATPCGNRAENRERIASLWEQARVALTASELSLRDRLFQATITRYKRQLDPRTLAVRTESRDLTRGVTQRAFVSIPSDSLARHGYARALPGGFVEYYAPDERVLLSEAFVRDHCFGLASGGADGEVGITFEPARNRRVSDIAGTIWLDGKSYELRRVVFRYTDFPLPVRDPRVGGEVHFQRLATGAWLVSRWFMRVPHLEMQRDVSGTPRTGRTVSERPVLAAFSEDGGYVAPELRVSGQRLATLTGRVVDSTGSAPLVGARVSMSGAASEAVTGSDGAFRLDSLTPGSFTLLVEHPHYERLGMLAGEQVLNIAEGQSSVTFVQAVDTRQVLRQLCGYDFVPDSTAAIRFVIPPLPGSETQAPRVAHVTWDVPTRLATRTVRTETMAMDLPLEANGGVTACNLPSGMRLTIEERLPDGSPPRRWQVQTPPPRAFVVMELRGTGG